MEYQWKDMWTTSPAEDLRNQYQSLVTYLDYYMGKLENEYEQVERYFELNLTNLRDSLEHCEGVTRELLMEHIELCKKEINDILSKYNTAINSLKSKQNHAKAKLEDYQWYARNEDIREKEYTYNELS